MTNFSFKRNEVKNQATIIHGDFKVDNMIWFYKRVHKYINLPSLDILFYWVLSYWCSWLGAINYWLSFAKFI